MTDWLDGEEMEAWRGLVEVFSDVQASLETELTDQFDLTEGDYGVLVVLSEAPERRLRMCDLASRLHLTPGGLTRRLDGLVARGFVSRESSTEDRRVVLAVLSDDGMAMLEKAAPVHVDGVRRHLLDHLSREQLRELTAAFEAVRRGRSTSPEHSSP
jgi:DNA-binding MarR family transcriptional regulator